MERETSFVDKAFREVKGDSELLARWRKLEPEPFLLPGWLEELERSGVQRSEGSLRVAIKLCGENAAILPYRQVKFAGVKVLTLGSRFNDRNNIPHLDPHLAKSLLRDLCQSCRMGVLQAWNVNASDRDLLKQFASENNYRFAEQSQEVSPSFFRGSSGSLLDSASDTLVKDAQLKLRRLKSREGEVRIEVSRQASKEDLEFLLKNHARRRMAQGHKSIFEKDRYQEFFQLVLPRLAESHVLHMTRLFAKDKLIALLVGMIRPKMYYYYMPVFDMDFHRYSPGKILLYLLFSDQLDSDIQKVDLLIGNEAYKYEWGAKDEPLYDVIISTNQVAHQFVLTAQRMLKRWH